MISVGLDIIRLGLDGGLRPAEDQRRVHPGDQPRRPRPRAAGPGRHHPEHPQAARPLALRAVCRLPRIVLPQRRGHQRDAVLAQGPGPRPCRHAGFPGAAGPSAHDAAARSRGDPQGERPSSISSVDCLAQRARDHTTLPPEEAEQLAAADRDRASDLLDDWSKVAHELSQIGVGLQYQVEVGAAQRLLYRLPQPRTEEPAGRKAPR